MTTHARLELHGVLEDGYGLPSWDVVPRKVAWMSSPARLPGFGGATR
jgi:hypothetical protein